MEVVHKAADRDEGKAGEIILAETPKGNPFLNRQFCGTVTHASLDPSPEIQ